MSCPNEFVSCPSVTADSDHSRQTEDLGLIHPELPRGQGRIFPFKVALFK
jgi:hypothetical protein